MILLAQNVVQTNSATTTRHASLLSWFRAWELYLILLVAGFLRFYQLDTTEFDQDQAILFRMARDAFSHGLLPTTSNTASIGIAHPAGVIYLFILPALLNPDPLGGAVLVAICSIIAVLLTYFFTRRYYGRLAGTIAALLYASAYKPLVYARFIWQPNLMPPFILLFFFALFFGVVERRKGWLFPALLLLGILYQMHETTVLLVIPLLVALLLAPHTFRWRDLAFAIIGLAIVFFPYLLWEVSTHFVDLHTVLTLAKQHAHIDGQALQFYQLFLSPNEQQPTDAHVLPSALMLLYSWLQYVMPLLVILALASIVLALFAPRIWGDNKAVTDNTERISLRQWWINLRAHPARCGLIILLVWQIAPLLILSRHSIDLHTQYFFMLLPGPFVLIAIFFRHMIGWLRRQNGWFRQVRIVFYVLACLLIAAQILGSTVWVLDTTQGNISNDTFTPYHNDLSSLKQALNTADQLAQKRHLNHVYVTTDEATQTALGYLSEQMHTPTTLFNGSHCLVLPSTISGPAVLLVGPHDDLTNALVSHFAIATLVATPTRLGGTPFHLYIVSTLPEQTSPKEKLFTNDLQLLDPSAQTLQTNQKSWQVTRWSLLRPQVAHLRTTYGYVMVATNSSKTVQQITNVCTFTTIRVGDQLLVAFPQSSNTTPTTSMSIQAKSFMQVPLNPSYGIFHMETDTTRSTEWIGLRTSKGDSTVQVS